LPRPNKSVDSYNKYLLQQDKGRYVGRSAFPGIQRELLKSPLAHRARQGIRRPPVNTGRQKMTQMMTIPPMTKMTQKQKMIMMTRPEMTRVTRMTPTDKMTLLPPPPAAGHVK
jgi:hypothetical protein